ncbi:hypothetical protein HI914_04619 [Erysiphe necator]|nr:hypothetical protein HI914_04619 [Erysiphe necator]
MVYLANHIASKNKSAISWNRQISDGLKAFNRRQQLAVGILTGKVTQEKEDNLRILKGLQKMAFLLEE